MFRAALAAFALLVTPAAATAAPTLQFLGEEILPTGLQFMGTEVGGFSSIAYDADSGWLVTTVGGPKRDVPGSARMTTTSTSPRRWAKADRASRPDSSMANCGWV